MFSTIVAAGMGTLPSNGYRSSTPGGGYFNIPPLSDASSGAPINGYSALQLPAVFACVRIRAEAVSSLPLIVYERVGEGKERATDNPVYGLLHDAPNPFMTAVVFRETLQAHVDIWGMAFAEIERDSDGNAVNLWPLTPDRVSVAIRGGGLYYDVRVEQGQPRPLPAVNVIAIPGIGFDGLVGYTRYALHRDAMGLGLAAQEFGSRFFRNGTRLSGVFEHPGQLSATALQNLRTQLEQKHTGLSNAHRVMILEEGMKWSQISANPDESQFSQTRNMQRSEIAAIYGIPPQMLGDTEAQSYASVEQANLYLVTHTLRPILVRWEQELNRKLLAMDPTGDYFCEHLVDGLLRGDAQTRALALQTQWQCGALTSNEWRAMENRNPADGGDKLLVQLNMTTLEKAGEDPAPAPPADPAIMPVDDAEDPEDAVAAVAAAHERDIAQTLTRLARMYASWMSNAHTQTARDAANQKHVEMVREGVGAACDALGLAVAAIRGVKISMEDIGGATARAVVLYRNDSNATPEQAAAVFTRSICEAVR